MGGEDRQRGSDLRYDMQITLEEAAFGTEKEIEVRKLDTFDEQIAEVQEEVFQTLGWD